MGTLFLGQVFTISEFEDFWHDVFNYCTFLFLSTLLYLIKDFNVLDVEDGNHIFRLCKKNA